MSTGSSGFAQFVPGFDFLQSLSQTAAKAVPQMPNLAQWVAPTLNVEELDKRINELRAVQFWLDQNARALAATIQALEVQKMTLATLKGLNFSVSDLTNAFKLKTASEVKEGLQKVTETASSAAQTVGQAAGAAMAAAEVVQKVRRGRKPAAEPSRASAASPGLVDPLQLWGALSQQFQHIASGAMQEVGKAASGLASSAASAAQAASAPPAAAQAEKPLAAPARKPRASAPAKR